MKRRTKIISAAIAAPVLLIGGAVAANAAGGTGCRTLTYPLCARSVASAQVVDNSLISNDLAPGVRDAIKQGQSPVGKVTKLESDGPYPGATKLQDFPGNGANSTAKVANDGATHDVWVQCADGKTALGGGFRLAADAGVAAESKVQVVASEPTQIKDGKVVYVPIEGDKAGSLEPNGWLVSAINTGTADVIVRPWVVCAEVAK